MFSPICDMSLGMPLYITVPPLIPWVTPLSTIPTPRVTMKEEM